MLSKVKKNSLITMSLFISVVSSFISVYPANAQVAQLSPAQREAQKQSIRQQLMQYYSNQKNALTPENAGQRWQSISQAPADFPLPLFNGTHTMFMQPSAALQQALPQLQLPPQITIKTQDSPEAVAQWYRSSLPRLGFVFINKGPDLAAKQGYMLKATSPKLACAILIKGDGAPNASTTINICAFKTRSKS